jgi:hypothetical protein
MKKMIKLLMNETDATAISERPVSVSAANSLTVAVLL